MKKNNYFSITLLLLVFSYFTYAQSPTAPAQGFNVFVENNATLNTNESEGAVAIGGDLILKGNYRVSIHDCGVYTRGGLKIGLLVNGKIDFNASSNGQLYVNSNYYAKLGNGTGAQVWYTDQNNATSPIRITQTNNYNSSTRVMLQANAPTLGNVSASNNPVIESNLIDFSSAFQTMRASATSISQNAHNAQITNANGQSISNTNLPNQVKINMQNGINYLNVTGADLNNVDILTYNNKPTATKILVINVNAPGTFNWDVWNQAGVAQQDAPYIIYNFYNTTTLNIEGNSTIEGTVFAPFADINKTVNQSNIEGQVIGKSIVHSGGEMHCAAFTTNLATCTTASNTTNTATIFEGQSKTLSASPAGGTWSIISGSGSINGNVYSTGAITTNETVTIRYTIAAANGCSASSDDVTFTVINCDTANNTTSTASITENETKTLTATPSGGTWSIVSGGGTINGTTYTPDDINTNTNVTIRYSIAANGSCAASSDDITFTVTPVIVCTTANNTTSTVSIAENETKTLTATPSGGTWSILSGGGTINGNIYTPANINSNTDVTLRYSIAANGSCAASSDDVTFTVTPVIVCTTANNTTSTVSIAENETKTLTATPSGGTWSIVSGGGTINGTTYTPDDINTNTDVTLRYSIAANGSCAASSDDITFTVTPVVASNPCTDGAIVGTPTANDPDGDGINNDCDLDDDNDGILDTEECEVVIGETPFAVSNGNSVNFNLAPVGNGFILDVTKMDNSFNLTINGTPLTTKEIQFQQNGTPTGQNIRFKDGSKWGQGGIPQIYQFGNNISQATPIVRFVIDANLNVTMYGSKVANGPLFELELFNGNTFNTFTWNANASNNFVLSQIVTGATYINGRIYGTSLNCDIDEDGIRNSEDLDSDGDGCFDVVESGGIDANNDGILDGTSIDNTGKVVGGSGGYNGLNGNEWYAHQLSIVNAPLDLSKTVGDSATFSVVASAEEATGYNNGTPIYATAGNANSGIIYKWYLGEPNNGGVLLTDNGVYSNTNSANLTISDVTGLDGNMYYVVVTFDKNDCLKEVKSAKLTVTNPPLGSIGDTVWFDTDGDGILDSGEPGLEGATVTLDPGTPGNSSDDVTTTTDANGNYLFSNLPAGNYTVTVDLSTVIAGIPNGKTYTDLIATFDADGLGTPNTSSITLAQGENNLDQDFAYILPSEGTSGGNSGGVESESLGDAISKIYVGRKKNSVPTEFVKDKSNLYNKSELQAKQPYKGKGQTMLDMFPTELYAGNIANVTSPTDILDYTIADEVLSVDFSINGQTKGVVLGIKTSDKVYNHTKASCDRLRGAEILNVMPLKIEGYNFLMQGIKQRNGVVEYAVSFAASKNNNDDRYTIQSNWYVNEYIKFNDMYNFQVWSTKPSDTKKLVTDIIKNLKTYVPIQQVEKQKIPSTYASKIYREKADLVIALRSTTEGDVADITMVELYSETANNIKHRYNSIATEIQQSLRVAIADGYEYDGVIESNDKVQDAFYHADGNWGLDFDKRYTKIQNYFVWNNFNREYVDDEYTINRNVELKATSDYDYLTLYKSLLPGTISADYSEYKYLAFTAKGSGLMELGLIKSSIQDWKQQYRIMVDLSEEEQTYYVPFEAFSSVGTQETINANDLTTLTFTFLPVEANTTELNLFISDVKFTKTAIDDLIVGKIEKFENEFVAYPNPSKGNVNLMLFSKTDTQATVTLTDITGKTIYNGKTELTTGKNELDFTFNSLKTGIYLLKVASKETNYGTSKIIFR